MSTQPGSIKPPAPILRGTTVTGDTSDGAAATGWAKSDGRSSRAWRELCARLRRDRPSICHHCHKPIDQTLPKHHPDSWTADHHPIPLKYLHLHGIHPHDETNLVVSCLHCNSSKQDKILEPEPVNTSRRW